MSNYMTYFQMKLYSICRFCNVTTMQACGVWLHNMHVASGET